HQVHTQNMFRVCGGFIGRARQLYAAAFASSTRMNLRLHHHHRRTQPLRHGARLVLLENHFSPRHRYAIFRQNCLGLIFVDLHSCSIGFPKLILNSASIYARKSALVYLEHRGRARSVVALEMKPACEKCGAEIAASGDAFICSYECTFCAKCTEEM